MTASLAAAAAIPVTTPPAAALVVDHIDDSPRAWAQQVHWTTSAANELKLATGPYKAARDAYVAATATYTKSLYE
jgi:hypothetical protein